MKLVESEVRSRVLADPKPDLMRSMGVELLELQPAVGARAVKDPAEVSQLVSESPGHVLEYDPMNMFRGLGVGRRLVLARKDSITEQDVDFYGRLNPVLRQGARLFSANKAERYEAVERLGDIYLETLADISRSGERIRLYALFMLFTHAFASGTRIEELVMAMAEPSQGWDARDSRESTSAKVKKVIEAALKKEKEFMEGKTEQEPNPGLNIAGLNQLLRLSDEDAGAAVYLTNKLIKWDPDINMPKVKAASYDALAHLMTGEHERVLSPAKEVVRAVIEEGTLPGRAKIINQAAERALNRIFKEKG